MSKLLSVIVLLYINYILVNASNVIIKLNVNFCPSDFTSKGAVVNVYINNTFQVINKYNWPDLAPGCDVLLDPNVLVYNDLSYLDFTSDFGELVIVNLNNGSIINNVKTRGAFFDGFTSFSVVKDNSLLIGPTPAVTQSGYCNDGCFAFGFMKISTGNYEPYTTIPYKAVMTDAHFYDQKNNYYWFQASYPLTNDASCSSIASDECLLKIDATNGKVLSKQLANSFTVYKYYQNDKNITNPLAFVYGFEKECQHTNNNFAFARINLQDATAKLIACVTNTITIETNPMIGGFSSDGMLFTHGSGNSEAEMQLLVYDTQTGKALLNTNLKDLPSTLGVSKDAPFVNLWSVSME